MTCNENKMGRESCTRGKSRCACKILDKNNDRTKLVWKSKSVLTGGITKIDHKGSGCKVPKLIKLANIELIGEVL
jgi:hypothetical protein